MNLLLFLDPKGNALPVIETPPRFRHELDSGSGRWARLRRRIYDTYEQLRERLDYRERLCSQLRLAETLNVYYTSRLDGHGAGKTLRRFLRLRYSKHGRWLVVDAGLAALGSVMTPIPGPNVFFFYPAARTLGHYLARRGAGRTLSRQDIVFRTDPGVDRVQEHFGGLEAVRDTIRELEERFGIENLQSLLERLSRP